MDMGFAAKLDAAYNSLAAHHSERPSIGVILGSGLGEFAAKVHGDTISYGEIAGFPKPSVQGHTGRLTLNPSLAVMSGRVHYYEGHAIEDVALPVFVLHRLGVRTLVVTNAAGGINRSFRPGELVLIRDHINLMGANPLRGPNPELGTRFPDMSAAYTPSLRARAVRVSPVPLREGIYAALPGPSYETPAEIRMLAAIGADMVGMSTVPEVIAASYLGMSVLGLSCITNMAAGILAQPLNHAEVVEQSREAAPRYRALLEAVIVELGGSLGEG
jgi:purine-nucleoside phosphorylase